MARSSSISHVVNGYSRYDVPESYAFTVTPGILYPARIQFVNARDRVSISQGVDFRSNPLAVPTFNPYTVRLHRFWVPLQLYHPEMRTNSSDFDMNNLSTNWIPSFSKRSGSSEDGLTGISAFGCNSPFSNSLMSWLRINNSYCVDNSSNNGIALYTGMSLPSVSSNGFYGGIWSNADTYLAYWDIVRNYYSFSQWSLYSFAWPASWYRYATSSFVFGFNDSESYFTQRYGNLQFLDAFYESQFYPNSVTTSNNTYNRSSLFNQIVKSDLASSGSVSSDGYPVQGLPSTSDFLFPDSQFSLSLGENSYPSTDLFVLAHPMAVVPSSSDRLSRMMPIGSDSSVSTSSVTTIPQLAVASRLQEYKDLLGAGGSRFSDWLETFFASKIEHVDRPKLLFSASQTVNAQIIFNQTGDSNFGGSSTLGAQGGSIAFNSVLGGSQSYYFKEPGYLIDMISIRPVYYWSGVRPDYLDYMGADYFNPIYNDIGYQSVTTSRFGIMMPSSTPPSVSQEPCYNEFRSSYDEVLGKFQYGDSKLSYWVQQRNLDSSFGVISGSSTDFYYPFMFVDLSTVNSPFASNTEDNFFVNLSYSVTVKNLVNKSFATRLSNR